MWTLSDIHVCWTTKGQISSTAFTYTLTSITTWQLKSRAWDVDIHVYSLEHCSVLLVLDFLWKLVIHCDIHLISIHVTLLYSTLHQLKYNIYKSPSTYNVTSWNRVSIALCIVRHPVQKMNKHETCIQGCSSVRSERCSCHSPWPVKQITVVMGIV